MSLEEEHLDWRENHDDDDRMVEDVVVVEERLEDRRGTTTTTRNNNSSSSSSSCSLAVSVLASLPMCMVVLEWKEDEDEDAFEDGRKIWRPIMVNERFERYMGPLYKFAHGDFIQNVCDGTDPPIPLVPSKEGCSFEEEPEGRDIEEHDGRDDSTTHNNNNNNNSEVAANSRDRMRAAFEKMTPGHMEHEQEQQLERIPLQNIEMTTVSDTNHQQGFPVRRKFDWYLSPIRDNRTTTTQVVLLGDLCTTTTTTTTNTTTTTTTSTETLLEQQQQQQTRHQQEAELIDFFQNAPIALHWLSGDGIVLWANQTELNVLGYTAEEYIGQPIMKFCPDEKELVLEIFQQLGTGNTIKDVPVRFRTKDNRIVYLLIDSNVKYNPDGSFGHTRCFIRDDTGRKIRQSRAALLLQETQKSLQRMDHFMARTLYHMRTPLYMTRHLLDTMATQKLMAKQTTTTTTTTTTNAVEDTLLEMARFQITSSLKFLEDIGDLGRFDQGFAVQTIPQSVSITTFARTFLDQLHIPPKKKKQDTVKLFVELAPPNETILFSPTYLGPDRVFVDSHILYRILENLLAHALATTEKGAIVLRIGYNNSPTPHRRLTFAVSDTGPGLEMAPNAAKGDLPLIFQRYHQKLLPSEEDAKTINIDLLEQIHDNMRSKVALEESIATQTKQQTAVGLSLSYHLVQALGGELRCSSVLGKGTTFCFSLPPQASQQQQQQGHPQTLLQHQTFIKKSSVVVQPPPQPTDMQMQQQQQQQQQQSLESSVYPTTKQQPNVILETNDSYDNSNDRNDDDDDDEEHLSKRKRTFRNPHDDEPQPQPQQHHHHHPGLSSRSVASLASCGVFSSQAPPSILVVEDTIACAKLLCMTLTRFFQCSCKWAANGQEAVDILQQAIPGTYDLILMDLRMPVMDGWEATKLLKRQWGIATPIVAVTGEDYYEETTQQECQKIGFDAFYVKPIQRNHLKQILRKFTGYEGMTQQ